MQERMSDAEHQAYHAGFKTARKFLHVSPSQACTQELCRMADQLEDWWGDSFTKDGQITQLTTAYNKGLAVGIRQARNRAQELDPDEYDRWYKD